MMLAASRSYQECSELEDLFIFGPTPRPNANWGFGIAGKDNKVSVRKVLSDAGLTVSDFARFKVGA